MNRTAFDSNKNARFVRNPEGEWSFVPPQLPPNIQATWELTSQISEADRKLSELAGTARTLPNPHLLIEPFTRREAVLSSRIEGTVASISDLAQFEALGFAPAGRTDVQEVSNYVNALEYGLNRISELPVSQRLMRELHEHLMKGARGSALTPGEFRKQQNWIGDPGCKIAEARYVPPPVLEMASCLNKLEDYIHADSDLPPLVRMALVHYQFEAIHPFLDGNGRIGRLLITLLLVSEGLLPQPLLYLSAFFERNRADYYRLLQQVSEREAWTEWITFFMHGVAEQASDAVVRAKSLQRLSASYRERLQSARASAAVLRLAESLFSRPVLTVPLAQRILGHSQPSAQRNIDKLVKAGVLTEVSGRLRGRVYVARDILRVVEDPLPE